MEARFEDMGMTDFQYQSHLRGLVEDLKEALEINPDNPKIKKMILRFEEELKRP